MRHNWTEQDDRDLLDAVDVLSKVDLERVKFWSAVAGRLAPRCLASADACRLRATKLLADKAADATSAASEKAWTDVAKRVEEYEADTLDHIVNALAGIRDDVRAMSTRLASIEDEQVRLRKLWE